jgi:hypothetical protein
LGGSAQQLKRLFEMYLTVKSLAPTFDRLTQIGLKPSNDEVGVVGRPNWSFDQQLAGQCFST